MTARADIAAAASTVDGVTCTEFYAGASEPGAGYVEWARSEWPNRFGAVNFWAVVIVVPTDPADAEQWVEEHRDQLYEAISGELVVTSMRPATIAFVDGPSLKALTIEGHRE